MRKLSSIVRFEIKENEEKRATVEKMFHVEHLELAVID